jgi:hypothetical protein
MIRNAAPIFAAAAFAVCATGCSSFVPFTYELRAQHRLSDDEVKNLQFYTSHQITLRREVQSEDREVTPGHKLRLVSGKSIDEVVIPAKTPGVALRVSKRAISVSFVDGTSLDFVTGGGRGAPLGMYGDFMRPFAVSEGTYRPRAASGDSVSPFRATMAPGLLGQYAQPPGNAGNPVKVVTTNSSPPSYPFDEPSGSYFLANDSSNQIPFAGRAWDGVEETLQAHLLIRSDKLEETEERRTVLPGVRLSN